MRNKTLKFITVIVELAFLVIFIVCITYLFKVNSNAKDEPTNRGRYIEYDPYNYYTEGDFCLDHLYPYISRGVFKEFDLRIKNIKKFSTILIVILFIKIILSFLAIFLGIFCENRKCSCFILILLLLSLVAEILFLIFFIIISVNYFKSKFGRFKKFSKCEYLGSSFKRDYDFVNALKKNFKIFFILGIISFFLNFLQIGLNTKLKKER